MTEPVTVIRVIKLAGHPECEPDRADVGGGTIHRADGETGEAFLTRVQVAAALAAKPGCVRAPSDHQADPSLPYPQACLRANSHVHRHWLMLRELSRMVYAEVKVGRDLVKALPR